MRQTALIMEKQTYPAEDSGRFDLRLDGATITPSAVHGTVSEPEPLSPGGHTMSERPAAGTNGNAYSAGVQCYAGERAGVTVGRVTNVRAEGEPLGTCVMIDVRKGAPDPRPPDPEPTPEPGQPRGVPPAAGGDGELDLMVRARAVRSRVRAGRPARFRVRVSNRGSVAATRVRLVMSGRQAGLRARALKVSVAGQSGPCVNARGLAFCLAREIGAGRAVTLSVTASSRAVLNPVRLLAVADASEPERVVRNNADRAKVNMCRPPSGPCRARSAARGPVAHAAC